MQPTSRSQQVATAEHTVPEIEAVRDGIWALPMPLTRGRLPYSFAYAIADEAGGVHIVDPGSDSEDNWGALRFALSTIGFRARHVRSVVVSHMHPDHIGMAGRFTSRGVPLGLHRAEQEALDETLRVGHDVDYSDRFERWGVPEHRRAELARAIPTALVDAPPPPADVLLEDGDRLDIAGRDVRVMHVPGHTSGSLALVIDDECLVMTGDTVLPTENPGIGLGGRSDSNPIADYERSLARLAALGDYEVLPGHGFRFRGLATRCAQLAAHHRSRGDQVRAAAEADPAATVWELASRIEWTGGWENLHGATAFSAVGQTAMHRELLGAPS
ncbi:MBL fold metallo-hydrolase [Galbitalea sp. SE-J8]|uniref:MBL fold metallo-hydrolase n=1 Tax=Galbitalea sp. SE-J8 TaxID=3054952 RepID=UPI00259CCDEA|nr:MBL fold metallo-hydrolase [Galbitalea sp. SE-J8]MDM4763342.1 MBL fold metallo-hydrolase [Galbitalea sp. SE-J8]